MSILKRGIIAKLNLYIFLSSSGIWTWLGASICNIGYRYTIRGSKHFSNTIEKVLNLIIFIFIFTLFLFILLIQFFWQHD